MDGALAGGICITEATEACCVERRRFFLFALIMVLNNQTAISIFRAAAAIFRSAILANMLAFLAVGFFLLFNGFIIQQGTTPASLLRLS